MRSIFGIFARTAVFACASLTGATTFGQAVQVLDSVDAFGKNSPTSSTVLEMAFRDSSRTEPFQSVNVGAAALLACQRGADQGLYCVDGATVRVWPDTKQVPYPQSVPDLKLFSCTDRDLGFDSRKPNPCTSLTVDLTGALWVAGRKANSHSLVKIVEKSRLASTTSCSATGSIASGWVELDRIDLNAPVYCAREWAPGRPVLLDINPIDGEIVAGFTGWPSVLGLEERKTVVLFPDVITASEGPAMRPIEFASGKTGWNLIGNEQLLGASLLQFGEPKKNYVLVTTTTGRVLAKEADPTTGVGTGAAFRVFQFVPSTGTGEQHYAIRVSSQSGRVYVSDRFRKEVAALKVTLDLTTCDAGAKFCLEPAREGPAQTPVVLSTGADTSPDGISVAPGIGIDLRDCGFDEFGNPKACPIVGDGNANNYSAAELKGVRLVNPNNNGMTVFQVKGIPDCRWWPTHPECDGMNVGPGDYLDLSNLLPEEVVLQVLKVLKTDFLPPLLVSPEYRGQNRNRDNQLSADTTYAPTIDLFFGITEPNVQFRDTFSASFDIADLAGREWGCSAGVQVVKDANGNPTLPDVEWDVVTTISEKYATVGGPTGRVEDLSETQKKEHVDMLVNTGCVNPTQVSGGRWSLYAYNLEVVPKGDSVYAILMRSLYGDLFNAQNFTACDNIDGQAMAPISSCTDLNTRWRSAYEKLDRCIIGSTYPRQSEAVNNCQSFLSQLSQYESALNSVPVVPANDPANRIGELKVRARVIRYVFESHFIPSIPPDGFRCDTSATGDCTP